MANSNVFIYRYSAKRNQEVEDIRRKYLGEEESKLDILRRLDARVPNAGVIPALCIGIIGALVFGIGMCFGLDVLVGADWLTLLFGIIGIIIILTAYPIYKYILGKTKAELVPEILRLTEEII